MAEKVWIRRAGYRFSYSKRRMAPRRRGRDVLDRFVPTSAVLETGVPTDMLAVGGRTC